MKKLKLATALLVGLTSGSALSYDVGGLDILLTDKTTFASSFHQSYEYIGDTTSYGFGDYELKGYGLVTSINDLVGSGFDVNDNPFDCTQYASGCHLAYTFDGYVLEDATVDSAGNLTFQFDSSDAELNFYLVEAVSVGTSQINATWNDTFYNTVTAGLDYLDLNSVGDFEAIVYNQNHASSGGDFVSDQSVGAGWYFNELEFTSSVAALSDTALDFSDTSSQGITFGDTWTNPLGQVIDTRILASGYGTADFSMKVPEPSSLAIFSAALLGFGAAARRRRKQ